MDLMLPVGRFYHWAYVVEDVGAAMASFTGAFGLRWATVLRGPRGRIRHRQLGDLENDTVIAFSIDGPPHIELVERRPGTLWDLPGTGMHHAGMWVDDVVWQSERLAALGMPLVAHGLDAQGRMARTAFHETDTGALVELLDRSLRPAFETWMAGGDLVIDER